jgi:hypothetical protein
MRRVFASAVILVAAISSTAACGSASSSPSPSQASAASAAARAASASAAAAASSSAAAASSSAAAASSSAAAASSSAAIAACTSHSCLTQEAELTLPGEKATDGSVITKAVCYQSSVKYDPNGIDTVKCDVTFTDGSVWSVLATIQPAVNQFSWQAQTQLS